MYSSTVRRSCLLVAALAGLGLLPQDRAHAAEARWTSLFDGKTLQGWVQRGGAARYEVKNGAIVGTTVPNTKNTFLCTERSYGDFVLELEFKVDPELNSGVQIRGQSRPDYQDGRVHGYQVEIDPDVERGRLWTGGLYDEGRRGWLADLSANEAARKAFKPGAWNRMRVSAIGDSIKTWINDVPAADLVDAKDLEGFIALQVHQVGKRVEPLTVAWRKIRIQELGRRAWRPVWGGKDLRGLKAAGGGSWGVEGNLLVGKNGRAETRHGLLFVEEPFAELTARAELRLTGGNGGIYLRAQPAASKAGATGLQVDLDPETAGGLYETGVGWLARPGEKADDKAREKLRSRGDGDGSAGAVPSRGVRDPLRVPGKVTWKKDDWNTVTVSARGGRVVVQVNDLLAVSHALPEGKGALALEVGPGQDVRLELRRLEVMSDSIPPAVPGYPIGWCIRAKGSAPDEAKVAGFEYVELALQDVLDLPDDAFEKTVERFRTLGIPALTGYNLIPAELKVVGPDVDPAKQDAHLARALPRVARLGVKHVIFGSGPSRRIPDGVPREAAWKQLVDFSRRLARAARPHGLSVLVQPLRSTDTNLVTTVGEAVDLVKAVRQPNFQLMVDYSFMTIQKEEPAVLRKAGPHLRHVQIANPNGRGYPMHPGEADYAGFFKVLDRINYRGGISVHARTDNFFADAPRALGMLRQAAATLAR
jgi:sugar phosphate isomerase/epimerase